MNKEEYNIAKIDIINRLGKPEYDYDKTPINESAKELGRLRSKVMVDARGVKRQQQNTLASVNPLETLNSSISEDKKKEYKKVQLPEIIILDKDLKGFDSVQAAILKDHFSNLDLEPKQLANKHQRSYQYVAGLLKSKAVELLRTKYFNEILNIETMKSILRAVKSGDSRTLEGATEYLKLMHNTEDNQGSKSIEDPVAEQKLKELGDTLANQ